MVFTKNGTQNDTFATPKVSTRFMQRSRLSAAKWFPFLGRGKPKMGARIWAKKEIGSMGAGFGFACCVLALGFFTLELMFQLGLALSWDR